MNLDFDRRRKTYTALCLTIRYNSRGGKKEKNETLLPRYASKDR
jgi:hypothetical protein